MTWKTDFYQRTEKKFSAFSNLLKGDIENHMIESIPTIPKVYLFGESNIWPNVSLDVEATFQQWDHIRVLTEKYAMLAEMGNVSCSMLCPLADNIFGHNHDTAQGTICKRLLFSVR